MPRSRPAASQSTLWKRSLIALAGGFSALLTLTSVASAQEETASYEPSEIEGVVAPIALYPDSLLAQVFMASTYPMEVVEAARWRDSHKDLKDKALEDALKSQNWDASVKSLTAFPEVLTMMNEKLDWTQKLGDMFLADQQAVMDAVQRLRAKAKAEGNLETTEQQVVTEEPPPAGSTTTSTTIIQIEPANPQVVYVPTYNPTVVYGAWPYPAYPPYSYYPPGYMLGTAALSFGMGMATAALWGGCNWGHGDVDIDVNNNFNRNSNNNWNSNRTNNKWNHNPEHRKGAGYRDQASQNKYGKGQRQNAASRDQFRGRAEQGRQQISREGASGVQRDLDKAGGARGGDRAGAGSSRPSASNRAGVGAGSSRPSASNRAGAGSSRPSASTSNRASSSGRSSSTFGGDRSGSQARRDSSRGHSSQMGGSRGGSRSSMGGSRGGGGGGRGGGGGGRGGGRR